MRPVSMLCLFLLLVASTAPAAVPQGASGVPTAVPQERGEAPTAVPQEGGGARGAVLQEGGGAPVAVSPERGGASIGGPQQRGDMAIEARFERGWLAWDEGRYIEALDDFIGVLGSAGGDRFLEDIALISGELYVAEEVAADGRNVRISPDGRFAAWETTVADAPPGAETLTHVAALDGGGAAMELTGSGFVFAPSGGGGAYLAVEETAELLAARAALAAVDPEDRDAEQRAEQRLERLTLANTHVELVDLVNPAAGRAIAGDLIVVDVAYSGEGATLYAVAGRPGETDRNDIYTLSLDAGAGDRGWRRISEAGGFKADPVPAGDHLLYTIPRLSPIPSLDQDTGGGGRGGGRGGFGGGRGPGAGGAPARFALLDPATGGTREIEGDDPIVAAGGAAVAFTRSEGGETIYSVLPLGPAATGAGNDASAEAAPREVFRTANRTGDLAISPSGDRLVIQMMLREDWELYLVPTGIGATATTAAAGAVDDAAARQGVAAGPPSAAGQGAAAGQAAAARDDVAGGQDDPLPSDATPAEAAGEAVRLTHEIQHDLAARFLTDGTILAAMGEGRHRRSYLYDVATLERTRLFHNNTVRTIAPEYEWTASADGSKVLIVSERDGDTVSPERAVYVVDLDRKVGKSDVVARLETSLVAERALRAAGEQMYAPIRQAVEEAVAEVSISRLYRYQKSLFDFGSKNITQPGNAPARQYLHDTYASFGYEPALQWFETRARGANEPIRTANVLAKLEGTENPELIYVVSSHFDSTSRGPGADDNTSGTVMLLETARVLAQHPLPYTVIFASFTGEESGLLGSREFVRQAVESGDKVVGALNNDMMGWSNDHHLDNTIRYSNPGIRDLQHAAAFLFSDLITYDALYYKSTDAAAYYEAYGDIVGGIGSYPVLGNPHYHQPSDVLETMNHEQIRETTRTNVASIMLLASSPSRINGLRIVERTGGSVSLAWAPSPEASVFEYVVRYGPADGPFDEVVVTEPSARLDGIADDTLISVKAVSSRGLRGWDWAHVTVGR
ncbi:MAG TPA: M20/M25/M40 family metallo-hydrolase [Acidobacteriota bacterium]